MYIIIHTVCVCVCVCVCICVIHVHILKYGLDICIHTYLYLSIVFYIYIYAHTHKHTYKTTHVQVFDFLDANGHVTAADYVLCTAFPRKVSFSFISFPVSFCSGVSVSVCMSELILCF
jgi:hypothetical protein